MRKMRKEIWMANIGSSNNHGGTSSNSNQSSKLSIINAVIGGVLLVSGTCIGAGMIGIPVKTGAIGFYPALAVFLVVWLVMTFSALCMLEVSLYNKGDTNLISMAQNTLGNAGKNIAWVVYIVFLYSLMAAYTAGGSTMVADMLDYSIHNTADIVKIATLFVVVFGAIVYFGAKCVDYVNRFFMLGLIVSYVYLLVFVDADKNLIGQNSFGESKYILFTLPILVTSFGYHLLIPTLKSYLKENIPAIRISIILGGLLPAIIYCCWEYQILSLIKVWGENGLVSMLTSNQNPAELIVRHVTQDVDVVKHTIRLFSLFALVSSFIGVSLGIFDFFADGLKIKKTSVGRLLLAAITFIPPAIYTMVYPGGFLLALGYAGIFAAILLIIYPTIMAYSGRYIQKQNIVYQVSGGKLALIAAMLFGVVVIVAEIMAQLKLLPIPHN
jgi:tyrosine-specific transport protein